MSLPRITESTVKHYGMPGVYGITVPGEAEKDVFFIAAKHIDPILSRLEKSRALVIKLMAPCIEDSVAKGFKGIDSFAVCLAAAAANTWWAALILAAYFAKTPEEFDNYLSSYMVEIHKWLAGSMMAAARFYNEIRANLDKWRTIAREIIEGRPPESEKKQEAKTSTKNENKQ